MFAVQLSTYVPRECGIATFAADLTEELDSQKVMEPVKVAAMDDGQKREYPDRVFWKVAENDREAYRETAARINESGAALVNIQHEFGIYGGEDGDYLLAFLRELRQPVITTLHTVLAHPTSGQLAVTREIARRSHYFVVMSQRAVSFLVALGIDSSKLVVIPHGVPQVPSWPRGQLRSRLGLEGRKVFLTFGLLSSGKGLEYVLDAIPWVAARHPDVLYLIAGETHPKERRFGDYRLYLQDRVQELGIEGNVRFDPVYLSKERLIEYLVASDAVITPYLGVEQSVSGTLTYALGFGKAVISTRYHYATETLRGGKGLLVDFRSAVSVAKAMNRLCANSTLQRNLETRAYDLGRHFTWPKVALSYINLYQEVATEFVQPKKYTEGVSFVNG